MNNIISNEDFAKAVKYKSAFELSREFTFWSKKGSSDELKLIAKELYSRYKTLAIPIFFIVALLTNTLMLFVESLFSNRWLYFEENVKDIIRQYLVGILFLSGLPIIVGVERYFTNNASNAFIITGLIIYRFALIVGIIKTFYDTTVFVHLKG